MHSYCDGVQAGELAVRPTGYGYNSVEIQVTIGVTDSRLNDFVDALNNLIDVYCC